MTRTAVQRTVNVLTYSGSLDSSGSTSGSTYSQGFSRIVGAVYTDASSVAGSGLTVRQSLDLGQNWDYITACQIAACSACDSAFSIEIVGDAVKVDYINGATTASNVRIKWYLKPVQ